MKKKSDHISHRRSCYMAIPVPDRMIALTAREIIDKAELAMRGDSQIAMPR